MVEIQTYQDLAVWREARILAREVYMIIKEFPKEELFGLTNQLRRCAVSVVSNIAEGCGRGTSNATINFLFIARGSLYEMETQLIVASDLGYVSNAELKETFARILTVKKLLNGFIRYFDSKADC